MTQALSTIKGRAFKHALANLYGYLERVESAMSGDMVLVASPATLGSSAAAVATAIAGAGFTRDVVLELQDADGNVHSWFSGSMDIAVAEVTAGDGVSAISGGGSSVDFVAGQATVTIEYTGTWAAADTQTLTVTGGTVLGETITNKTSVDTLVA